MQNYEYHKTGYKTIRVVKPMIDKEDRSVVSDQLHKLTRKEINIVFGYLYDLSRFNEYATGYLGSEYVYDIVEKESQIVIYYEDTSAWKLPISVARLV